MDKSWGGARHSGAVLITETGYEILTRLNAGYLPYRKRLRQSQPPDRAAVFLRLWREQ
ncbi:hypothetical protein [Faecalispora sporosphaeroides]|uniref:hypothetical protein n=1 Tax=Faecalispora sporosphaeroides TaxID=1549 RepID=UPI000399991B|nr:hypothetical protein [Faecalispora sporosphaeroides]